MPTADRAQTIRTVAVGCTLLALGGGLASVAPVSSAIALNLGAGYINSLGIPAFQETLRRILGGVDGRRNALQRLVIETWSSTCTDAAQRWRSGLGGDQMARDSSVGLLMT
ncbi:MAG: hypothetical protein U0821_10780 [Chloroflexota bacterium]